MSEKIGRNDPCWCGSGKKLKKCHPDSSRDGFSFYDFEKIRKEVFSKKTCMVSKERNDCSERICKAHTVSKSALSLIAENGHLYHFEINGFKEQKEIANVLDVCKKETQLLNTLLEKFKEQKRGLMQKLLIGEWRVKTGIYE